MDERNRIQQAKRVYYGYHSQFYKYDTDRKLMNMLIDIDTLREFYEIRLYIDFKDFIKILRERYTKDEFKEERSKLFFTDIMRDFYQRIQLTNKEQDILDVVDYCNKNNIDVNIIKKQGRRISMDIFTI